MKRSITFYTGLAILLLAGSCSPKYDETNPKYAPVTEAVFASGTIEPQDAYMLNALFDGYLVKANVTENDLVHTGEVLFRLDNKQQNTQVAIAKTNVDFAKINASNNAPQLLQLKSQINAARVKMQTDSLIFKRNEQLIATNSVSRQDYDNAKMNYESSVSSYQAAVENYKAGVQRSQQDLQVNMSQYQNAEAGNRYYELTSVAEGRIYQIFKKQGDLVRKGDQVAQIGNADTLIVSMDIDEGSIDKIKLGQQVLVELNTQKNKTYEARISKIYPHFNETAQSYKVEAKFLQSVEGLIAGTQLQANIITNKKDRALLIPKLYMLSENKVLVKKGKAFDTVKVAIGINSDEWVEILSGVNEQDKIVKPK